MYSKSRPVDVTKDVGDQNSGDQAEKPKSKIFRHIFLRKSLMLLKVLTYFHVIIKS